VTKRRPPVSFAQTLHTVSGFLGLDNTAGVVGRSKRTVHNWSDPDTQETISVEAALKLDVAFIAAGSGYAPFHQTYRQLLDEGAEEACADSRRLVEGAARIAKEAGEAVSALVMASVPGAPDALKLIAAREAEQLHVAVATTMPHLRVGSSRAPEVAPPAAVAEAPG
jgi:hypothetical protein